MSLGVEMLIERVLLSSRRVVGNDGSCALRGDVGSQPVAVVGGIGHDEFCRQVREQRLALWRVSSLSRGKDEANRATEPAHRQVDLGAQPAARAAESLIFRPPPFERLKRADGRGRSWNQEASVRSRGALVGS